MSDYIKENNIVCPECGKCDFTDIRKFNLMFKTFQGVTEDAKAEIYLRPETAQGIFVNFKNVMRTTRRKLPMGIAQVGKSFRNEITPGNFIFRIREFEQMELEFFCKPGTDLEWFAYWKQFCREFLDYLGIKETSLRLRDHEKEELSHYSNATTDFEFKFPFGWGELWGIADRTNYDLRVHQEHSKVNMEYLDPQTNEKYLPYCIEPSVGVGRLLLAIVTDAYEAEVQEDGEVREVLHLIPQLAPFKVAVLPLVNKLNDKEQSKIRRESIGFVFQFYNLIPNLSVEDNILLPVIMSGKKKKDYEEKLTELLKTVGLLNKRTMLPKQLSGGQQQRVAIARAVIMDPSLILADEPTGNLDSISTNEIMRLFRKLNKEKNITIIQVTHSKTVAEFGDKIIYLKDGQIENDVEDKKEEVKVEEKVEKVENNKIEVTVDEEIL